MTLAATYTEEATPANPFTDVPEGQYYYEPVLWAVNHEPQITNGKQADLFAPNDVCTRAQFVTFLWRAAGEPEPTVKTSPFTDVKPGSYYEKAVLWAYGKGITQGVSATQFAPNQTVTRGQVVTFLWRYAGSPAPQSRTTGFRDVAPNSPYYNAILWANEQGIAQGYSPTAFGTNDGCTRAQTVTFLYRCLA